MARIAKNCKRLVGPGGSQPTVAGRLTRFVAVSERLVVKAR